MSYLHTDVGEADEGTHGIPGTRTPMGETAKEYARLTRERIESWPRWIRTTIPRSKVWCPAVGRGASDVAGHQLREGEDSVEGSDFATRAAEVNLPAAVPLGASTGNVLSVILGDNLPMLHLVDLEFFEALIPVRRIE